MIPLRQVLDLVGPLDDSSGQDTARERFRRFLAQNLLDAGVARDYVEECLRQSGEQYCRALQDLVNHVGSLLGFEVTPGRYKGVASEIGFDGMWKSPTTGLYIVVEVKTTDAFTIKTDILVGYIDRLISEKRVPSWEEALGLYVVGRPDADLRQLTNAIVGEKRTHQLRIVSVERLLSLAELLADFDRAHQAVLTVLQPPGPTADPFIELVDALVAREIEPRPASSEPKLAEDTVERAARQYYLAPVASSAQASAEKCIAQQVGAGVWAFGEKTGYRKSLNVGDMICFYAARLGVVAHARVKTTPTLKPDPRITRPSDFPYTFELDDTHVYLDKPVVVDSEMRLRLDAFRGREDSKYWSWFVIGTCQLNEHDFALLTRTG